MIILQIIIHKCTTSKVFYFSVFLSNHLISSHNALLGLQSYLSKTQIGPCHFAALYSYMATYCLE